MTVKRDGKSLLGAMRYIDSIAGMNGIVPLDCKAVSEEKVIGGTVHRADGENVFGVEFDDGTDAIDVARMLKFRMPEKQDYSVICNGHAVFELPDRRYVARKAEMTCDCRSISKVEGLFKGGDVVTVSVDASSFKRAVSDMRRAKIETMGISVYAGKVALQGYDSGSRLDKAPIYSQVLGPAERDAFHKICLDVGFTYKISRFIDGEKLSLGFLDDAPLNMSWTAGSNIYNAYIGRRMEV